MNTYIFLGGAIVAEVIGTTFMKYSEGFTRLWPSVGTAQVIALPFICFPKHWKIYLPVLLTQFGLVRELY